MSHRGPSDEPITAEAHEGEVVLTGPGRIAVALTAEAAAASAERILVAVTKARAQRGDDPSK